MAESVRKSEFQSGEEVVEALEDLPNTDDLEDPSNPISPEPFENYSQGGSVSVVCPATEWDDVLGLHKAKQIMKELVVLPFRFPNLFKGQKNDRKNILLYGPPGCGKTMLMNAVARESRACLMTVNSYSVMSRMVTDKAQFMRAVFACARDNQPCILLIEDIEVLVEEEYQEARTELLRLMAEKTVSSGPVIGMTRFPWLLEGHSDLQNSFSTPVYVPLPDESSRHVLLRTQLNLHPSVTDENIADFARRTEGYTMSDIMVMLRDAAMEPIRGISKSTHFKLEKHVSVDNPDEQVNMEAPCSSIEPGARKKNWADIEPDKLYIEPITTAIIVKSVARCKPCVRSDELEQYMKYNQDHDYPT